MKGQQITPWSIYNQPIADFPLITDEKTQVEAPYSISLPKINRRASALDYHQPDLIAKQRKINQFKTAKSTIEHVKQDMSNIEREEKQQELRRQNKKEASFLKQLLQKQTILMIIKQDLRQNQKPMPPAQVESKPQVFPFPQPQTHHFHLDNILAPRKEVKLPKITSLKECIIQNCAELDDKCVRAKDLQQQLVHKLLKEKIEVMISQKMKVLSNKKQLTNRSMVYNFSYKDL